jgi:hypothetical protein
MPPILTIVPSRGRQKNHKEVVELFKETAIISDLCFGLDEDDHHNYEKIDDVIYEINPPLRMNGTLNLIANKYADKYNFIFFMGDDHRPKTFGWDSRLMEPLKNSVGLSYGNDLLQKENLATAVLMSSKIVKILGFFAPPTLKHFYLDNFWMDLGKGLGNLNYFDDVIIEHMHPCNEKSKVDNTYSHAWSVLSEDIKNYDIYKKTQFSLDLEKVNKLK